MVLGILVHMQLLGFLRNPTESPLWYISPLVHLLQSVFFYCILKYKSLFLVEQDNLSRGNLGAVKVLQELFPEPGRLQFIYADLGDAKAVNKIFSENAFDAVMHFAAVAYVGESTQFPLK